MTLAELAKQHQIMSPTIGSWRTEKVLLWYADLDVKPEGQEVVYACPRCGRSQRMDVQEFLFQESSDDLRCDLCRGDPEERGGALD